jgi:hypothetical protein
LSDAQDAAVGEADAASTGRYRLFSYHEVAAGLPPEWQADQLGEVAPRSDAVAWEHWSALSDAGASDIKGVWELSRFSWAFALARAYAATREERYRETFGYLFADWCRRNPPNSGQNWMCGQEATFRLMAVLFAYETMGVRPMEQELLSRFVVATGERIAANLGYALSQKNNHGISECVGLITAALAVPEHAQSAGWLQRGMQALQRQVEELIYEDGSFSQHSLVYHRVLLHDLVWMARRLQGSRRDVPAWLFAAGQRALRFLQRLTDPVTGEAPLFGSNDGACVLPLSAGDFLDMRPTVQMAAAVFEHSLPLPPGPWDEAAAWMVDDFAALPRVDWPSPSASWRAPVGGYALISHGGDRLFMRCPERYRHRPSQADLMHVDVWMAGQAVARDGGSFSYNTTERFKDLSQARHHNVLTVEGLETFPKAGRFLYLPWPRSRVEPTGGNGAEEFTVTHGVYPKWGLEWRRTVSAKAKGGFVVRDVVEGAAGRRLTWHWRLADCPWQLSESGESMVTSERAHIRWRCEPATSVALTRADDESAFGWCSRHYASVEPCYALRIELQGESHIELVTEFLPADGEPSVGHPA